MIKAATQVDCMTSLVSFLPLFDLQLGNGLDLAAIVTHMGAAADSGHYIAFVKQSVFHPPTDMEDHDDWYKFDDDKVSIFPKEKLGTLDGGGALHLDRILNFGS
jgi:hypothetical protein